MAEQNQNQQQGRRDDMGDLDTAGRESTLDRGTTGSDTGSDMNRGQREDMRR